jgi:hypothetical protein
MDKKKTEKKEPLHKRAIKKVGEYAKKAGEYVKEEVAHQRKRSMYNEMGRPLHRKHEEKKAREEGKKFAASLPSKKTHSVYRAHLMRQKLKEKGVKEAF